jgi:hypothetical protein
MKGMIEQKKSASVSTQTLITVFAWLYIILYPVGQGCNWLEEFYWSYPIDIIISSYQHSFIHFRIDSRIAWYMDSQHFNFPCDQIHPKFQSLTSAPACRNAKFLLPSFDQDNSHSRRSSFFPIWWSIETFTWIEKFSTDPSQDQRNYQKFHNRTTILTFPDHQFHQRDRDKLHKPSDSFRKAEFARSAIPTSDSEIIFSNCLL